MQDILDANHFLDKFEKSTCLLIDVRSEKEFYHAHIPGAINIPLLNDDHRHLVGIEYKTKGREEAVALGFKLVGPLFHQFIERVKVETKDKEVMIYCWRGGMRSNIMSWLLSLSGHEITVLNGGYKSFRKLILSLLHQQRNIVILGGYTGSGKTEILKELKNSGEQVIDLESLANHRGSAFGNLGLLPQPSNEHFENLLGCRWRKIENKKLLWIEGESHSIGKVKIPDPVFDQLQSAPLIEVLCSREYRKRRIISEYGSFSKEDLSASTTKLKKRLGNLRLSEALLALHENRMNEWVDILLNYYDGNYEFSLSERKSKARIEIEINESEERKQFINRLIKVSNNLNKEIFI